MTAERSFRLWSLFVVALLVSLGLSVEFAYINEPDSPDQTLRLDDELSFPGYKAYDYTRPWRTPQRKIPLDNMPILIRLYEDSIVELACDFSSLDRRQTYAITLHVLWDSSDNRAMRHLDGQDHVYVDLMRGGGSQYSLMTTFDLNHGRSSRPERSRMTRVEPVHRRWPQFRELWPRMQSFYLTYDLDGAQIDRTEMTNRHALFSTSHRYGRFIRLQYGRDVRIPQTERKWTEIWISAELIPLA